MIYIGPMEVSGFIATLVFSEVFHLEFVVITIISMRFVRSQTEKKNTLES